RRSATAWSPPAWRTARASRTTPSPPTWPSSPKPDLPFPRGLAVVYPDKSDISAYFGVHNCKIAGTGGGLEEGEFVALDAAQRVVVQHHAADAPVLRQHAGLRCDRLGGEDT